MSLTLIPIVDDADVHRRIVARRHHQRWGYGSRTLEAFNWPMGGRGMEGAVYTPAGQIANKGRSRVSSQLGGPLVPLAASRRWFPQHGRPHVRGPRRAWLIRGGLRS